MIRRTNTCIKTGLTLFVVGVVLSTAIGLAGFMRVSKFVELGAEAHEAEIAETVKHTLIASVVPMLMNFAGLILFVVGLSQPRGVGEESSAGGET